MGCVHGPTHRQNQTLCKLASFVCFEVSWTLFFVTWLALLSIFWLPAHLFQASLCTFDNTTLLQEKDYADFDHSTHDSNKIHRCRKPEARLHHSHCHIHNKCTNQVNWIQEPFIRPQWFPSFFILSFSLLWLLRSLKNFHGNMDIELMIWPILRCTRNKIYGRSPNAHERWNTYQGKLHINLQIWSCYCPWISLRLYPLWYFLLIWDIFAWDWSLSYLLPHLAQFHLCELTLCTTFSSLLSRCLSIQEDWSFWYLAFYHCILVGSDYSELKSERPGFGRLWDLNSWMISFAFY